MLTAAVTMAATAEAEQEMCLRHQQQHQQQQQSSGNPAAMIRQSVDPAAGTNHRHGRQLCRLSGLPLVKAWCQAWSGVHSASLSNMSLLE
jgi:hypothetical protein